MPLQPSFDRLESAYQTALAALLAERTPEGYWVGELSTSALSTAVAVSALALVQKGTAAHGSFDALIAGGLKWLAVHQNTDGGWGGRAGTPSSIEETALALEGLAALLNGVLALMAIMFVSTALLLSVLFSSIIAERKRELGLLRALGARRRQIIGMLLTEAGLATALGGLAGVILGILLMRVYEHSLVYYLDRIGIPFVWLNGWTIALIGAPAA